MWATGAFLLAALQCLSLVTAAAPPKVTDSANKITYVGVTNSSVDYFLNIRYGQDTGGVNRFSHPKPFTYKPGTTVQATQLGPACPQTIGESLFGFTSNGGITQLSEDCLSLRITRPTGTTASAKLPVMVWIYGGSDEMGSINDGFYDPTGLVLSAASKGFPVIVAAMNYRVNVFGFANNDALRKEGSLNSGLLDQRLALEWIQKNIALFGGDPSSITLFGQSDGGTGVGYQLTAYGGQGSVPFQRGIMESGSPIGDPGATGNFTAQSTSTVASFAGCSAVTADATLNCLRGISMNELLTAVEMYENQTKSQTPQDIFFPVVDGSFIPAAPSELLRTGKFHKNISVIAGWAYNDGSIFTDTGITSDSQVQAFILANYPNLTPATVSQLLALYPTASFEYLAKKYTTSNLPLSPQFFRAAQILRDVNFACPALYTAYQVAAHNSKTTAAYLYEINQTAFAALESLAGAAYAGVIHTAEIPYVFDDPQTYLGTPADVTLASQVSGSWAHFAAAANPVGNGTLTNWTAGFTTTDLNTDKSSGIKRAEVRVIGGPTGGMKTYSTTGPEMLIQRCAVIVSQGFLNQLQV